MCNRLWTCVRHLLVRTTTTYKNVFCKKLNWSWNYIKTKVCTISRTDSTKIKLYCLLAALIRQDICCAFNIYLPYWSFSSFARLEFAIIFGIITFILLSHYVFKMITKKDAHHLYQAVSSCFGTSASSNYHVV